jgi:hypothetical protein
MYKSYETLVEYLETERSVYNDMLQTLENFERGKSSINLSNIEKLLSILEKNDIKITDERTSKRTVQSAIFLHHILSDLIYLTRNSTLSDEVKRNWIRKLENLLQRAKRLIDDYYGYYGYLPKHLRFWHYWYYEDRRRYPYLPYYPYIEEYYQNLYPPKQTKLSSTEIIWKDVTSKTSVNESSLFVPRSFLCLDDFQYQEYLLLTLRDNLKQSNRRISLSDENKDNDKLHKIADYIIKEGKKVFQP